MAWSPTLGYAEVDAEVLAVCERALSVLESLGAEVVEVDPVFDADPVGDWLTFVGGLPAAHPRARTATARRGARLDPVLAAVVDVGRARPRPLHLVRVFDECHEHEPAPWSASSTTSGCS